VTQAINLVVSCTSRKRYDTAPGMAVHEIKEPNLDARLRIWKERLGAVRTEEYPAAEIYMGDHWCVARSIPKEAARCGLSIRLWISSAGYGLIRPDTPIKPYQATFARGEQDYIGVGITGTGEVEQKWWAGVCAYRIRNKENANSPRSLQALAEAFPRTPMVVALSVDYLRAVKEDLAATFHNQFFLEHLSIVSCGTRERHSVWRNNLLPCDGSMSRALGGTLTSLNVRVVRRLFQLWGGAAPTVEHLAKLTGQIGHQSRSICKRAPSRDSEVADFIYSRLNKAPGISKTKLLGEFRNAGQACEQRRFGEIYARIRREVMPELYA